VIIIIGSIRLILDSVDVLLEGTPRHIDLKEVEGLILTTDGVSGVHDLHVWTISSGIEALSAHISHESSVTHSVLLGRVRSRIHDQFGIDHLTIQMETLEHETEALYVCTTSTRCFEPTERKGESHHSHSAG
jgi:cobalt-zinc-cadmium efflux system protein